MPVIEGYDKSKDTRIARDPKTSKAVEVPASMTYREWRKKYDKPAAKDFEPKSEPLNKEATFDVFISTYPERVNERISEACKQTAPNGSKDNKEHLVLVNTKNGDWVYEEVGDAGQVGGPEFYKYLSEHPQDKFAFVHNHPSGKILSLGDLQTFLGHPQLDSFIAAGHNGKVYVAYGEKKAVKNNNAMSEVFQYDNELLKDLRILKKQGIIDDIDFRNSTELLRVNFLLKNYCSFMEVQT